MVTLVLELLDDDFEGFVVFAFALLHAQHHVAVHLHEAAVAVPRKTLVVGRGGERKDGFVVEAEVEDRVHHPGHRVARSGTDGDEQRHVFVVAELAAHDPLHVLDAGFNLRLEDGRIGAGVVVEIGADLGGDREPGRHGKTDAGHFRQVGALAA